MRNLKKILALVLALVMTFSVMSVAGANFEDADKVSAKYNEAVEVLAGLGVFRGDDKGNFNPQGSITRAEVAAIIYRIDTGDVTDEQVAIYADYNKFDDVKSTAWYAGYVNYCANALYIKGYDEHTFGPNDKVTGYQALAMILRAVGYDKNGEFSGSAWQVETAKYANALGITANVNTNTLGVAATRELVAELLFRTIAYVPQVTYTLLKGYNQYKVDFVTTADPAELAELENDTIGEEMFNLWKSGRISIDQWGRPGYCWYMQDKDTVGFYTVSYGEWVAAAYCAAAIFPETPVASYTVATTECEIALDLGLDGKNDIPVNLWDNGEDTTIMINPIHEHVNVAGHLVGGQGTILEVYEGNPYTDADDRIVMIETYLAQVIDTTKQVTDKAGHVITKATNTVAVYGGADEPVLPISEYFHVANIKGNNFATGDYILVNVHADGTIYAKGLAKTIDAAQTTIWWENGKHYLDKVEYADNENFCINAAEFEMNKKFTWFLDEYNNLLGSIAITSPKSYAVVLGAQWLNANAANGYAQVTVRYMDGTTETGVLAKVNGVKAHYANTIDATFDAAEICTTWQYNDDTYMHMYEVEKDEYNNLYLTAVVPQYAGVVIADGYSAVTDADGAAKFFIDNYTEFLILDTETGAFVSVTGYDELGDDVIYDCALVDVVMNTVTGYAKYVYAIGTVRVTTPKVYVDETLVYFTGDKMNFYETKNTFALYGVVDYTGSTEALHFAKGDDAVATRNALIAMLRDYKDALCVVYVRNGIVVNVRPVSMTTDWNFDFAPKYGEDDTFTRYMAAGSFEFIGNGVLVDTKTGDRLNVNASTTIINDGEVATVVDLSYLKGANLYLVHDGNFVSTIFVTERTNAPAVSTMAQYVVANMTAATFTSIEKSFTYEIAADTTVIEDATALVEAVDTAVTQFLNPKDGGYYANYYSVEVNFLSADLTKMTAKVEITVKAYNTTFTTELTVKLVNPKK